MTTRTNGAPTTKRLSKKQARALFDKRARKFLDISGDEFLRRWEAGELDPGDDRVVRVAMLLPFGR